MRSILTTLAVGLFATAAPFIGTARADGLVRVRCVLDGSGNTSVVSCPVDLTKGHDYYLVAEGESDPGKVEVINPAGETAVYAGTGGGYDAGAEFRAAFTATYQVRVTRTSGPPIKGVFGRLETDCNADSRSTCTLPVKGSRQGVGSTLFDQDSYKMVLTKGRIYTVTFKSPVAESFLDISDKNSVRIRSGQPVDGVVSRSFRAPYTGIFWVTVFYMKGYTLSLK